MTQMSAGGWPSRIAIVAAAATLALTIVLALPALQGPGPNPSVTATPTAQGSQQVGDWLVEATVSLLPDQGYRIDVRLIRDLAAPPPARLRPIVILSMDGMHAFEPPLLLIGAGEYQAEGRLPMPGRWRVSVGFEEGMLDLEFDLEPSESPTGG